MPKKDTTPEPPYEGVTLAPKFRDMPWDQLPDVMRARVLAAQK